jgi:hypothetical protein
LADQRPILGLEAAILRNESGTVGIRQTSNPVLPLAKSRFAEPLICDAQQSDL